VEEKGALLGMLAGLTPGARQVVLLERAQQAARPMAVAVVEQAAEAWSGQRAEGKRAGRGYRGGHEQTAVVLEGAQDGIRRPRVDKDKREREVPTLVKLQSQD